MSRNGEINARIPNGFSLIEIVVVIVVAAIILPAIIIPFVEGSREIDLPVVRGKLAFLAQEEMEKNIVPFDCSEIAAWAERDISGFPGYRSSCEIVFVSDGQFNTETDANTGYKRVSVNVSGGRGSVNLVIVKTDWAEQP